MFRISSIIILCWIYSSNRFEEVTEVLDDGLPEPIPGSSHSLSDSLNGDIETIVEI